MKRFNNDVYTESQLKKPKVSSEEESLEQPQITSRNAQKLTRNDALAFLKIVKEVFKNNRERYDAFLEVMREFKARRISKLDTIERVKELFKEHKDLIVGFNTFLPKRLKIAIPLEDEPTSHNMVAEFEYCVELFLRIKTHFEGNRHAFGSFLDIMNKWRHKTKSFEEAYQEVVSLLQDHVDLLKDFTYIFFND